MTKYEAVAQAIKADIENGVYTEGQAIPTEELLTAQYDVSRQTIRKALALLVEDDLIIKRQGSGSVVRPKRLNPRTGKIAVVATYISDYIFPSQLRAVDEVLSDQTGICFDYAAVMTAMLRAQRIPTKLVVGYSNDLYHAWISTYVDDQGWVDNVIQFDGKVWTLMDPTLAANNDAEDVKKYVGDGSNYIVKYTY